MKKAILIATILLLVGILICAGVLFATNFDFTMLGTDQALPVSETVTGDFLDIQIELDTTDVEFRHSQDGSCRIEGNYPQHMPITAVVENSVLTVKQNDQRKWYHHIGLFWGEHKLVVYLPETAYGQLTVSTDTGDIRIPQGFVFFNEVSLSVSTGDISFAAATGDLTATASTGDIWINGLKTDGNISLTVSTGDIFLENVVCNQLSVTTSSGDVKLNASNGEYIEINTDTGDVKLTASDGESININTDTGDVGGTLLTDKIFIVDTDTGKVLVPETTTGGKCKITTGTGDIKITIE